MTKSRKKKKLVRVKPRMIKSSQLIGEGAFSEVYKISPRRIVKVFTSSIPDGIEFAKDEIIGSKIYKFALPILEIIEVSFRGRRERYIGLVKRFIPREISPYEFCRLDKELDLRQEYHDAHYANYRKDSKGNLYLIDTQTEKVLRKLRKETDEEKNN